MLKIRCQDEGLLLTSEVEGESRGILLVVSNIKNASLVVASKPFI